ncbi:MAG: P-II family nitrogen regulator [Methylotetracoccus sp.]
MMKLVTAIIPPHLLSEVREALLDVGVAGSTISHVLGHGRDERPSACGGDPGGARRLVPQVKLELLVADALLDRTLATILEATRSGSYDEGKIFLYEPAQAVRIRTREMGDAAID